MNKKTLTQIDYYRIRDEIAEYCVSQEGKKNILEREPFKDIEEIEKNKNLSREWEKYFSKNYSNPLFGWENIKNLLPIIKMNGSSLTLEQVNNLGHFILSVNNVKKANLNLLFYQSRFIRFQICRMQKKRFFVLFLQTDR